MALYLGSSEINPVISTIKEVPTEQDLTLMGNELRKACAYTNVQLAAGKVRVAHLPYKKNTIVFSDLMDYNGGNLYIDGSTDSSKYIIIDGKCYSKSVSDTSITLTQYGVDTNWILKAQYWEIKGNRALYNGVTVVENFTNVVMCPPYNIIIDGVLYNVYDRNPVDNTGVWTFFDYYQGIKDGTLYYYYNGTFFPVEEGNVSGVFGWNQNVNSYYSIDNTLYSYSVNTSTGVVTKNTVFQYESKIKRILSDNGLVLLENNKVYYRNTLIQNNVTNARITSGIDYGYLVTNNGDIYSLTASGNTTFLTNIGDGTIIETPSNYCNGSWDLFIIKYANESTFDIQSTLYTTKNTFTKAWELPTLYSSDVEVQGNALSIIYDNKVYTRDNSKDSTFTFVPDVLQNHTFNDQELCQAYLNAGARQQQNS